MTSEPPYLRAGLVLAGHWLLAVRYVLANQADNVRYKPKNEQSKAGIDRREPEAEGYLKFFAKLFFKKAAGTVQKGYML